MYSRVYQRKQRNDKQTPHSLSNIDSGIFQVRPFTVQLKRRSHQPDLKTSLNQAERYGHHLDKIQCAISTTPIQMSTEEEEKKLTSGMNLEVNNLTSNKLDNVLNIASDLKSLNHEKDIKNLNKNINIKPNKHFTEKITRATEIYKEKDHKQNSHEHLTPHGKNKASENKAEEPSLAHDPEVTILLNKSTQNNLAGSATSVQNNQTKNFITAPSTYNEDKNTGSKKAGSRSHYLANREAMNMLGNNKSFATTQRAVKIPVTNTYKSQISKVEDSKQQVKLKDAAELVRDQVINEDRQVKEHVQGTLNLDPAIVAKKGGEQLILQKMQ